MRKTNSYSEVAHNAFHSSESFGYDYAVPLLASWLVVFLIGRWWGRRGARR